MDKIIRELKIPNKNVFSTASSDLYTVVVHSVWLRNCFKNKEIDPSINNVEFTLQPSESIPYPWKKIFIKVVSKKTSKVLSLPRYKMNDGNTDNNLSFAQLLQYVAQTNHRNLWKESFKKYSQNSDVNKESAIVNLVDHDQLLTEVILRLYGCNIIKMKLHNPGKLSEHQEMSVRPTIKPYDTHTNLLTSMFTLESDHTFFIVYQSHYDNNLLDCLNFSPNLIDKNYSRGLFLIYQLLYVCKTMSDRGLSIGTLKLQDIYLNDNLWLQVVPPLLNNIQSLDPSLINEQNRSKATSTPSKSANSKIDTSFRSDAVKLESLCMLWVRGRISNLDYLLHLNQLAGRSPRDPLAHYIVPWVTDFSSKCGRNWRDLSKSKYRLNKGDRQLDMTYDVNCPGQIPHHVSDALSDITYYVYLARRTPKEVLCKHVRNKWVPAEYPASIQRMQEWTPDECIPEFYTDPIVFKSIHEDLPDLGIPTWASCIEEFITKHREALESAHVSDALHHWIDLTFGYKLSGGASVKAKNVCLSLVDGHVELRRGTPVQILSGPHPPRRRRPDYVAPYTMSWTATSSSKGKPRADSSEEMSEEDEESIRLGVHVSRSSAGSRSRRTGSSGRTGSTSGTNRTGRAHSTTPHYKLKSGNEIIQLPKEYNPAAIVQNIESLDNFRTKCFFTKAEDENKKCDMSALNLYPMQELTDSIGSQGGSTDDNSFTNHMFLATYEQGVLRKLNDTQLDNVMKEIKNRSFNERYTTDAAVYKQFIAECKKRDTQVIGCLIVEIFLNTHMRALRITGGDFHNRYNTCRTVLKYNFSALPKCVSYVACLLLNVQPLTLSFKSEISVKTGDKKLMVTDKGLPPPTASQMLQPLLMQHLIPFPQSYTTLYNLLSTLHDYEITSNELNILYTYECDGVHCEKYQTIDKTKLYFYQRLAEGKILSCQTYLETLLGQINSFTQFDVLDIFLTYYIELLRRKETSVLAAWYLFDMISKLLGPEATRKKLLKHILNLFEDDELVDKPEHKSTDVDSVNVSTSSKHKFVKLYHNIFLLQLMVRLGLQCFLDNFIQHLVEAVGGYKDVSNSAVSPGHVCHNQTTICKKLRYSDDSVRNALSTIPDAYSPDTSYSSEKVMTPIAEKTDVTKDADNRSENELFLFEPDKERQPSVSSRSKSPTESIDSYTITTSAQEALKSPTPSTELRQSTKESPDSSQRSESSNRGVTSPTIDIPRSSTATMFTSHSHFGDDDRNRSDVDLRPHSTSRVVKSLELNKNLKFTKVTNEEEDTNKCSSDDCKISDMSSESILWLSHRLGPVLTCRYITRNLLKMLTLCYIGKENLVPWDSEVDKDDFDAISIVNSKVVGDKNAMKVIKCLTCIIDMYGDQVVIFQYLPHMSELIASSRVGRRLSPPLEGGVVACLQLLKYLLPTMSDVKLMEHLQDTILKCIIHPILRLSGSSREFPSGTIGRAALTLKAVDIMYALATRLGPEVTRTQLCVPALQRFFLIFDKAIGKTENLTNQESETNNEATEGHGSPVGECYVELRRDGSEAEWAVRGGRVVRATHSPPRTSPPYLELSQSQEQLTSIFDAYLAYTTYTSFTRMIGSQAIHRSLKNADTIIDLVQKHSDTTTNRREELHFQSSFTEEISRIDTFTKQEEPSSCSNSFGSNVTLVGNRIDIVTDEEANYGAFDNGFDVVAYKTDSSSNNRHLRGDWLIYWEHEIGRPEKENRFNLKQIKLQSFIGHTHTVKSICCLDNENSFMSGSKDKTVKLWSLRNQGDGNAATQCNWTYTGHKKGVLSLSFIESLRLAVSTDSVVHVWDPFMESVVSQLDHIKVPISLVRSLPGPSSVVVAATTDATLKIIDVRAPQRTHDLKLVTSSSGGGLIRCMCVLGDKVSVGMAGGHLATLDLRTGRTLALWKPHDGEVLSLAAADGNKLLSSGLDQTTAIWHSDTGELIAHLKGTAEPVHCMSVYHKELISGTTNNRIGVHTALDQDSSFSSTKLRSDTFKGVLTCMSVLPLNRLLLLGSDNGSISLLC